MSNMRQVGLGILAALISVAILLGSLTLAFTENPLTLSQTLNISGTPPTTSVVFPELSPTPTRTPASIRTTAGSPTPSPSSRTSQGSLIASVTPTPEGSPTAEGSSTASASPTPEGSVTPEGSITPSPTAANTPTPEGSITATATQVCRSHPADWMPITIRDGDSLQSLADKYNTTVQALRNRNCLYNDDLIPGKRIYVPSFPATQTTIPCGPLPGWGSYYTVVSGDTLSHIAGLFKISVAQLKYANCLTGDTIFPTERLLVPFTLPPTATNGPAPTKKITKTPRPPTLTPPPSRTPAPTHVPTDTPVPPPPPSDTPVPPPPSKTPVPTVIFTIQPDGGS